MKKLLFLSLLLALLVGCEKDNSCDTLNEAIIGQWKVVVFGINVGEIEFKADGTLIDEDDSIIGKQIGAGDLDNKTYVVNSETSVTAKATDGTKFVDYEVHILSYNCDEITFEDSGITGSLKKK